MQEKTTVTPPEAAAPEQRQAEDTALSPEFTAASAAASSAPTADVASADAAHADAQNSTVAEEMSSESAVSQGAGDVMTASASTPTADAETTPKEVTASTDTAEQNAAPDAPAQDAAATKISDTDNPREAAVCAPSAAEKLFRALTPAAPLMLLLLLFAQGWMWLIAPALYAPCEEPTLSLLEKTLSGHLWLAPMTDSMAALPLYPWLAGLLSLLPLPAASLYSLLALSAAALLLLGTWGLGRACGLGAGVSFAAGCLLLASLLFPCMAHTLGAETLTAGLMACALAGLIHGWKKDSAWFSLPFGFLCTALAGLSGGIIPFAIPLVTSLLFILWTGRIRRAQRRDALAGFAIMLFIPLSWVAAIIMTGGHGNYLSLLMQQLLAPFSTAFWPPANPLEQPVLVLLCALAPWPVLILFVSWGRVLGSAWSTLKASRSEQCGHAWLWLSLFAGLACCMLASTKPLAQALVLLPLAALLLGKALSRLSPLGSRMLFCLLTAAAFLCALTLTALTVPFIAAYLPFTLPALAQKILAPTTAVLTVSAVLLIACVLLGRFTCKAHPCGALLVTTLLATLLMQPVGLMLAPALNGVIGKPLSQLTAKPAPAQPAPAAATPAAASPAASTAPADSAAPSKDNAANSAATAAPAPAEAAKPAAAPEGAPAPEAASTQKSDAKAAPAEAVKPAANAPADNAAPSKDSAASSAATPATTAPEAPKTTAAPEAAPAPVAAPAAAPAQAAPAATAPVPPAAPEQQSDAPKDAPAVQDAPAAPAAQ